MIYFSVFHNYFPSFFSGKKISVQRRLIDKKYIYYFLNYEFEQKAPEHPTLNRKQKKCPLIPYLLIRNHRFEGI